MNNYNNFVSSILNIKNEDKKQKIIKIVQQEKKKLLEKVESVEGFCKYLAAQIEYNLKQIDPSIIVYYLDLKEIIGKIDHVALVVEYYYNGQNRLLLIDPTFYQFTEQQNKRLIELKAWPSSKMAQSLVSELLNTGVIDLDEEVFNDYLNSFLQERTFFSLNDYLNQNNYKLY